MGSDGASARRALARAVTAPHGLATVSVTSDQARVGVTVDCSGLPPVSRGDRADLLVAITEDGLSTVVKGGENRGRVLSHASVVRQLAKIGEASGDGHASAHADLTLSADWNRERLNIVGLVQERRSRTILASALVPLTRR